MSSCPALVLTKVSCKISAADNLQEEQSTSLVSTKKLLIRTVNPYTSSLPGQLEFKFISSFKFDHLFITSPVSIYVVMLG